MSAKPLRASATFAAATLAILVLAVFSVLQDYGPESAIRRFHDAVRRDDVRALAQVTEEDPRDARVQHLAQNVALLSKQGANYRILRMDREPRQVAAEVQYVLPDGRQGRTVWVVVKTRRTWRVEASETGRYFRRTLGL